MTEPALPSVRYAYEFTCTGCGCWVFSAVHYGDADLCLMCEAVGPTLSRQLADWHPFLTERRVRP